MKNKTRYNKSRSKTTLRNKKSCATSYKSFERDHEKSALYIPQKSNTAVDTALVNTIKASFSPSKITPQSDYYTYINYNVTRVFLGLYSFEISILNSDKKYTFFLFVFNDIT